MTDHDDNAWDDALSPEIDTEEAQNEALLDAMMALGTEYEEIDMPCPFGETDEMFGVCERCNSKDEAEFWDSCANRESRMAYSWAMAKDD